MITEQPPDRDFSVGWFLFIDKIKFKCRFTFGEKNMHIPFAGPNETCILCLKDTGIPKNIHIEDPRRMGRYVVGMGQVCEKCEPSTKPSIDENSENIGGI